MPQKIMFEMCNYNRNKPDKYLLVSKSLSRLVYHSNLTALKVQIYS
jgi:hypothetical protein